MVKDKINWDNISNAEIEMKLSELEFEFERIQLLIDNNLKELSRLSMEYNNGRDTLNKRINPQSRWQRITKTYSNTEQ